MELVPDRRRLDVSERPVLVGILNRTRADQHDARIGGQAADLAYRLRAERG
jgi:hypothetical protein